MAAIQNISTFIFLIDQTQPLWTTVECGHYAHVMSPRLRLESAWKCWLILNATFSVIYATKSFKKVLVPCAWTVPHTAIICGKPKKEIFHRFFLNERLWICGKIRPSGNHVNHVNRDSREIRRNENKLSAVQIREYFFYYSSLLDNSATVNDTRGNFSDYVFFLASDKN